jgi:hypothetical protein
MILSLIVASLIIAGTAWLLINGVKSGWASKRHMSVILLAVVGAAALTVGIRFGILGEFQLSERMKMQGAPIPLVVFVLEGQNWTDFVKPKFVSYVCMVANALFPVGCFALLWRLLSHRLLTGTP